MTPILRSPWLARPAGLPSSRARRAAADAVWSVPGDPAAYEPTTTWSHRRRPRAGHAAGGLPARAVPDAVRRTPGDPTAGGARCAAACCRSTGCGCRGRCAGPCRDFEIRVDTAFEEVVDACADPRRPPGWIDDDIRAAYLRLHELGWAHSVEAWRDGRLAGGLYGVAIGGLFAGESMFHRERDASKVALVGLVDLLRDEHADRAAARRAVGHAAPGHARGGRDPARGVPAPPARGPGGAGRTRSSADPRRARATADGAWCRETTPRGDILMKHALTGRRPRAGRRPRRRLRWRRRPRAAGLRVGERVTGRRRPSPTQFCEAFNSLFEEFADGDAAHGPAGRDRALKDVGRRRSDGGRHRPEDIPADAREGYELIVETVAEDRGGRHPGGRSQQQLTEGVQRKARPGVLGRVRRPGPTETCPLRSPPVRQHPRRTESSTAP